MSARIELLDADRFGTSLFGLDASQVGVNISFSQLPDGDQPAGEGNEAGLGFFGGFRHLMLPHFYALLTTGPTVKLMAAK